MKADINKRIIEKSSYFRVLLFLLATITSVGGSAGVTFEADTIIIGGKKLIVEREVVYDTLATPGEQLTPEEPKKRKLRLGDFRAGFRANGYLPFDQITTSAEGAYSSLNAYLGSDSRIGSGVGFEIYAERKIGRRGWFVTSGVGIDYINGKNLVFDPETLDDSLFTFASFEDDALEQILLFRFDIGSETDTLSTPIFDDPYRSSWLRIPLGAGIEREISRETILRFCAGIDLRIHLHGELPDFIFLPDLGNDYIIETGESLSYRSFLVTPWISAGARWQMDRRWWLSADIRGTVPMSALAQNDRMSISSILLGGQIGVMYLFGR